MDQHLYPRFLVDESEFNGAKKYWIRLCSSSVPEAEEHGWKTWLADENFANHDGESAMMFSWLNERDNKGVCVQQLTPSLKRQKIEARMDLFGASYLDRPIEFIYISCELTPETAAIAGDLICEWSKAKVTRSEMANIVESRLGFSR